MNDETQIITKPAEPVAQANGSTLGGVSWRGWLAAVIVVSFCSICLLGRDPNQAMSDVTFAVIGWYFGQKGKGE